VELEAVKVVKVATEVPRAAQVRVVATVETVDHHAAVVEVGLAVSKAADEALPDKFTGI